METWTAEQYRNYLQKKSKPAKYRNTKCYAHGLKFDSIKERTRYLELKEKEGNGLIAQLGCQTGFELLPKNGKNRAIVYKADFCYFCNERNVWVVEDVKSEITAKNASYVQKRKLFLANYPNYEFVEVIYTKTGVINKKYEKRI